MIEYLKENSLHLNSESTNLRSKVQTESTTSFDESVPTREQEHQEQTLSQQERRDISEAIDEAFQAFYARAFAPIQLKGGNGNRNRFQKRNSWHRVALGIELLQLQLGSSDVLVAPYHKLPKGVIVQALATVTRLQERCQRDYDIGLIDESTFIHPDTAFRLLQRLVTGVGVRNSHRSKHFVHPKNGNASRKIRSKKVAPLYEVDFNRVLNIYSSTGKMDMAHRVIALQERTPHAPALSPVTYSILVKGYGKLCDAENIDTLLRHAAATDENQNMMKPDTIFFNSLMDAYINCRQLYKAETILMAMVLNDNFINGAVDRKRTERDLDSAQNSFFTFEAGVCPPPNLRSFNIMLKGYAKNGLLQDALNLTEEMKTLGSLCGDAGRWWDHVTTNTLVQTAVVARDFELAQNILDEYTVSKERKKELRCYDHPNADAYTTLMDGYAKNGQLKEAISLLKIMKNRNLEPNEYHYSCLIGSLARKRKIDQAEKMLAHVRSAGVIDRKHQRAIYNAYISGLVKVKGRNLSKNADDDHDKYVDKALLILREMIDQRIMPDANTVSIILDGFGHCLRPRMKEAVALVEKLETQKIIPTNHIRVTTALIRVCGSCNNLDGAITCFRRISHPDVAAINALIDAAVRTGKEKVAIETFNRYFHGDIPRAVPDVVSFSTLIGAYLKKGTFDGSRAARELYQDMRFQRRILPDNGLVDM
jgi:pentatricopeptide repeat protein